MAPTLASALLPATPALVARQATTTIVQNPSTASCSGQYSGGTLAGAILGTFFGTLLILYLFTSVLNNQNGRLGPHEVIVERKVRSNGSRRRRRSRSGSLSSVRRPSRVYSTHD